MSLLTYLHLNDENFTRVGLVLYFDKISIWRKNRSVRISF